MSEQKEQCWCRHCETERLKPLPMMDRIFERSFIVCPDCGNKRCPKATCHGHECGGSNDSGQTGSEYGIETCAACHQPAAQGECTCTVDQTTGWTDDKTFTPRCNVCGLIVGAVVRERAAQGEEG